LIVFNDLREVVLDQGWLEVCQIESAVVIGAELARDVENDFFGGCRPHKLPCKAFADCVDLLVGADKVVSAHRGLAGGEEVRCELLAVVYNDTLR